MVDNLAQLDYGGSNCQYAKVYLGPTIGWVWLPVTPELEITSAAALNLNTPTYYFVTRVILKAAVTAIALPAVASWVSAAFQRNLSGFDRSIWIKDLLGNFQANNCTITPNGTDLIDGQASYQVVSNHALIRLYPLTDLSGWYVG